MNKTIKNKKELLDIASGLDKFIKKNNWVSRYDSDSDSLSITKPELSSDSRIRYFDEEVALYLNEKGDIEGLFIEYFKSNFVEHHKDLDKVVKNIENKKKNNSSMITLQKKDVSKIAPDIEDELKSSLAENLDVGSINNK